MSARFEGRVVFVTGIARGQGRMHAQRFAAQGASVIGIDVCEQLACVGYPMSTKEDLDETIHLVEGSGGEIVADVADVRDRASMQEVLDRGLDRFGRLDYVIANAGVLPTHGEQAHTMDAWQACLDVTLTGTMNTVEITYPKIVAGGRGGAIVLISSMAGLMPMMRTERAHSLGLLGYAAAKSALVNLGRNYASFLAPHNVRVNSLHPGGVNTPMIRNALLDEHFATADPQDLLVLVSALPVPVVEPEDVVDLALWMCSDEGRYFTGNAVRMDAGASLR